MKTIYKYQIKKFDGETIHVHFDGDKRFCEQVLHCDVQDNIPCLWATVDTEDEVRPVRVVVIGTGNDRDEMVECGMKHVGSFMLFNGAFVGHVFAENKYPERSRG